MELGELTKIWECSDEHPPDKDTTLIARIGTFDAVGKVVEDRDRGSISNLKMYICIKPIDNNKLVPRYLYYAMQYVHMQGHWKQTSTPFGGKQKINVKDVKRVPLQTRGD